MPEPPRSSMGTNSQGFRASILCLVILCTGCTTGLLVTYITEPVVIKLDNTQVGSKEAKLDLHEIREPLTGLDVRAQWASNAIGDAAKAKGLQKVYHADLHTLSVLLGIYKRQTIIVYGD